MKFQMKAVLTISAVALSAVLNGCASTGGAGAGNTGTFAILREALVLPVADLKARADKGEAHAQFSLSIVYEYGLHQVPVDDANASDLRRKATASRGYTPITQYIAGLNGKPGRTAIINIPRYDVSIYEARANQNCAKALNIGEDTPQAFEACDSEDIYRSFKPLWTAAK